MVAERLRTDFKFASFSGKMCLVCRVAGWVEHRRGCTATLLLFFSVLCRSISPMLHFCCLHTVLRIRIEFQHNIALHEQGYTWVTSCPVLTRQRTSCVASFGCCCLTDPDRRLTLWSLYLSPARMMRPLFFFLGVTRALVLQSRAFSPHTPRLQHGVTRGCARCAMQVQETLPTARSDIMSLSVLAGLQTVFELRNVMAQVTDRTLPPSSCGAFPTLTQRMVVRRLQLVVENIVS